MTEESPRRRVSDYDAVPISRAEMRDIIREENAKIIANTFAMLGVDIESQESRNAVRDDFVWVRQTRASAADMAKTVRRSAIGIVVASLLGGVGAYFKLKGGG